MNTGNTGVTINMRLKNIPDEVAEEVVKRTVEKASTIAKQFVRVDLGNLKGSITPQTEGLKGEVYSESDYSLTQEFGDPSKPNYGFTPYLRPAASVAGSQAEVDKSTKAAMRRYNKMGQEII
jgi:hypothetical protein